MSIPEKLANELLVKCGRRCCICRRFGPLHLQIHHIVEKSKGGNDDFDNLIAVCLTCHSDIHTHTKLTRRFTIKELKGHRDAVVEMVASGKFGVYDSDKDISSELIDRFIVNLGDKYTSVDLDEDLPPHAIKLLLDSAQNNGLVYDMSDDITSGTNLEEIRQASKFKDALEHLENNELLAYSKGTVYRVTHKGFLLADKLIDIADTSEESKFV